MSEAIFDRCRIDGSVAECGCYKGGSTAKLSLACRATGKRLLVFDSFEGLPEPEEWDAEHRIVRPRTFMRGEYRGSLEEVRENVGRYGALEVCDFHRGWFMDTLPELDEPIAVAFVDVDLALSTRQVLEHVWPLVVPGGILFLHDATDEKLQEVFCDPEFLTGATDLFVPRRDELASTATKTLAYAHR